MNMKKYFLLLFVRLIGCSSPMENSNQNLKEIDVPLRRDNHEIKMSVFVDSISYIPLETNDKCLIGSVGKIVVTENNYYIIDKNITCSILCFDKLGKFVRKIGERGVAPGQYVEITDVNVYKDRVYLWDCSMGKLFVYSANGHLEQEVKEDYWATTFYVLDDSWVAFCSGYTTNKAYLKDNSYPNLLFVNINTGQTSPDLYYDSRICTTGIVGSDFNFISNGNLVFSLNDTVYQALSPSILKRKYAMRFGEELEKTQKEYVERLKTEKIDAYQGDKLMKEIPCMYMFLETPSYSFLRYSWRDYYYVGIINHKESDTYMEAVGYKQNAVVNDMDDMAVFIPLTTYKNAVYSCISPGRFIESKAFGKQVELDDNPIIVKFELK